MEQVTTYRAVERDGKGTRVHRTTCKRVSDKAVLVTTDELRVWARPIVAATCCKPKLDLPVTASWQATEAEQVNRDVAERVADEVKRDPQGTTSKVLDAALFAEAEQAGAGTLQEDRMARLKAAEAEAKLIGKWKASGATNGRPVTPNLDALEAERQEPHAPSGAKGRVTNGNGNGGATPRQSRLSERAQQAAAVKRDNPKRGPGVKMDDEHFQAYVAGVRSAHPDETSRGAMEYAYYVDKLAFSKARWDTAWAAAEPKGS